MWREWWFWVIVLVAVLLLFGAPKLPALAKSLGQSMRIFRKEVKTMKDERAADNAADGTKPVEATPATAEAKPSDDAKPSA
ncbi:MAG: twin-arginine translocase TatA/TatE family subunit [Microbacteriaceae bacterium]|nr:twin-arginine translocase TatA/TatE family subunit [Microbacteriaceae bacterium]